MYIYSSFLKSIKTFLFFLTKTHEGTLTDINSFLAFAMMVFHLVRIFFPLSNRLNQFKTDTNDTIQIEEKSRYVGTDLRSSGQINYECETESKQMPEAPRPIVTIRNEKLLRWKKWTRMVLVRSNAKKIQE